MSKGGRRTARDTATNEKPLDQIKYLPWPGRQTSHLTVSFVVVLCKKKKGGNKKKERRKNYTKTTTAVGKSWLKPNTKQLRGRQQEKAIVIGNSNICTPLPRSTSSADCLVSLI